MAKSYVIERKYFLFHSTEDGATASAIVSSLVETAKANDLSVFQYLYTLLLYMPDYKNESSGIKQLMPWSDFIKEHLEDSVCGSSHMTEGKILNRNPSKEELTAWVKRLHL